MNSDNIEKLVDKVSEQAAKKETKHSKAKSLTFWCTIWSILIISYIVIAGKTDFISLALALSVMPVAYAAKSTITKQIYKGEQ